MPIAANMAFILEKFEGFELDEIVGALQVADDAYHNGDDPIVDDNTYDTAKRYAHGLDPAHVYFTGIGSGVRGGKVKLPYQMGSLNQVEIGEITDWVHKNKLADEQIAITDKLDGVSVMLVYGGDGVFQIAYSRGDGINGADVSRHIREIPSVPKSLNRASGYGTFVVRAEVIISKAKFEQMKKVQSRSGGDEYKNPRNATAGIMNSKTNKTAAYSYIDVIAYEVVGNTESKFTQLQLLKDLGFMVVEQNGCLGKFLSDEKLTKLLNERRANSPYELDGLVLDVNDKTTRSHMNPTSSTLNPAYAVKYKVASADNVKNVRVVEVEWNVSKHGYLKPRVRIEPVELMGVTVQHATGFNAKFIKENSIGKGAIIKITRSGDVIPFILETLEPGKLELPAGNWTDTGVDLVVEAGEAQDEIHFKQVVDFFESIDAPMLREGNVKALFDKGYDTIEKIINAEELDFILAMGANGQKAYEGLVMKLSNIYFHDLIGSLPYFGRGVGKRKFAKLLESISREELMTATVRQVASVEGFDEKTAEKIVAGLPEFKRFWNECGDKITITVPRVTGMSMNGQLVVFTGFRDKALETEIEANGGKMQSAVSGKTTILVCADPTSNSGKMQKARANGTMVIGIDELREMLHG